MISDFDDIWDGRLGTKRRGKELIETDISDARPSEVLLIAQGLSHANGRIRKWKTCCR